MQLNTLLKSLGKEIIRRYPYINCGGCCVYAAIITEELHKLNIPAGGIVTTWDTPEYVDIDTIRHRVKSNAINEWRSKGVNFTHVGVEFTYNNRKYHYDSEGCNLASKKFREYKVYNGRLQLQEMKELTQRQRGWNTRFLRKDIPAIRKFVKFYFNMHKDKING